MTGERSSALACTCATGRQVRERVRKRAREPGRAVTLSVFVSRVSVSLSISLFLFLSIFLSMFRLCFSLLLLYSFALYSLTFCISIGVAFTLFPRAREITLFVPLSLRLPCIPPTYSTIYYPPSIVFPFSFPFSLSVTRAYLCGCSESLPETCRTSVERAHGERMRKEMGERSTR